MTRGSESGVQKKVEQSAEVLGGAGEAPIRRAGPPLQAPKYVEAAKRHGDRKRRQTTGEFPCVERTLLK